MVTKLSEATVVGGECCGPPQPIKSPVSQQVGRASLICLTRPKAGRQPDGNQAAEQSYLRVPKSGGLSASGFQALNASTNTRLPGVPFSINSSARPSSESGNVIPSVFAALEID